MTHADLIASLIAEKSEIPIEKAELIFKEFRHDFPEPDYLDRELSSKEAEAMLIFYRNNKNLLDWISQVVARHNYKP